jgi:sigma-E factor negative regulatory protein RseA
MKESDALPNESLSALMDGEAVGDDRTHALSALLDDPAAQRRWHAYHVAGDAMRSADLAPSSDGLEFLQRLQRRLTGEAMAHNPALRIAVGGNDASLLTGAAQHAALENSRSANASSVRWNTWTKSLAFGACAAVAIVFWGAAPVEVRQAFSKAPEASATVSSSSSPGGTSTAAASVSVAEAEAQVILRDPDLDALLAAHRAMGGNSALQLPSGFLRNATFERPNR